MYTIVYKNVFIYILFKMVVLLPFRGCFKILRNKVVERLISAVLVHSFWASFLH